MHGYAFSFSFLLHAAHPKRMNAWQMKPTMMMVIRDL